MGRLEDRGGPARKLRPPEFKKLMASVQSDVDQDCADLGIEARLLSDGRVVTVGPPAVLWESRELLLRMLRRLAPSTPKSLVAKLRTGAHFVDTLDVLLASAPAKLKLPNEALDYSVASVERIDEVRRRKDGKRRIEGALDESVAYIGEVVRRALGGRWEMRFSDDGQTPEPIVTMKDGRVSHPGVFVLREIDLGRQGSLLAVTELEIESFGPQRDIKVPPPDDA